MPKQKKVELTPAFLKKIKELTKYEPDELGPMAGIHRTAWIHKEEGRQTIAGDDVVRLLYNLKKRMPRKEYVKLIENLFIE